MPAFRDLTGQRFGKLFVERLVSIGHGDTKWNCICDCGNEKIVMRANLLNGSTNSCGCIRNTQGGHSRKHFLWRRWMSMIERCDNSKAKDYERYGGRGIKVCDRWRHFPSFLEDMESTFFPEGTLDRYPNYNGNYEPGNVRWATHKEQMWSRPFRGRWVKQEGLL